MVFLAILYALRPDLVDLSKARTRSNKQNLEEAFRIAERELRIPRLLDPDGESISSTALTARFSLVILFVNAADLQFPLSGSDCFETWHSGLTGAEGVSKIIYMIWVLVGILDNIRKKLVQCIFHFFLTKISDVDEVKPSDILSLHCFSSVCSFFETVDKIDWVHLKCRKCNKLMTMQKTDRTCVSLFNLTY